MKIAILGGGIMGLSAGYYLARGGAEVEVFEASPALGGLAGAMYLPDGTAVDRFYHTILPRDDNVRQLCSELGIDEALRFQPTRTAFFYRGRLHSMNNIVEFLRFPPLGWIDRFRLGLTVIAAQMVRDWRRLEGISVERWLVRVGGRKAFQNIWRPLLRSKFDGTLFDDVPATWVWSRLVRMKSARRGATQQEGAGHLVGGHATLVNALAQKIRESGGTIHTCSPAEEIVIEDGAAVGVRLGRDVRRFDAVLATVQTPVFERLIPLADAGYREFLRKTDYLGVVCPLLVLDRPLTGYWTVNITDDSIPFTGVIETTAYIDPKYVGGHHLVYLPKYHGSWQRVAGQVGRGNQGGLAPAPLQDVPWLRHGPRALLPRAPRTVRRSAARARLDFAHPGGQDAHSWTVPGNDVPDLPGADERRIGHASRAGDGGGCIRGYRAAQDGTPVRRLDS